LGSQKIQTFTVFCVLKASYQELGEALYELGYRWKSLFRLMKVAIIFSNLEVKKAYLYGSVSQHLVSRLKVNETLQFPLT